MSVDRIGSYYRGDDLNAFVLPDIDRRLREVERLLGLELGQPSHAEDE